MLSLSFEPHSLTRSRSLLTPCQGFPISGSGSPMSLSSMAVLIAGNSQEGIGIYGETADCKKP